MTAYANKNFQSKKALKDALAAGEKVGCFSPGLGEVPYNGKVYLSGPHYPQPHKWYAEAMVVDGFLTKVK